jgi:hypothetical protein
MIRAQYTTDGSCNVTANGVPCIVQRGDIVEMTDNEFAIANTNKSFTVLSEGPTSDDSNDDDGVVSTFIS